MRKTLVTVATTLVVAAIGREAWRYVMAGSIGAYLTGHQVKHIERMLKIGNRWDVQRLLDEMRAQDELARARRIGVTDFAPKPTRRSKMRTGTYVG